MRRDGALVTYHIRLAAASACVETQRAAATTIQTNSVVVAASTVGNNDNVSTIVQRAQAREGTYESASVAVFAEQLSIDSAPPQEKPAAANRHAFFCVLHDVAARPS